MTGRPNPRPEQTVATGRALTGIPVAEAETEHAPTVTHAVRRTPRPPQETEATTSAPVAGRGRRTALVVGAVALIAAAGAGAAVLLTSGDDDQVAAPPATARRARRGPSNRCGPRRSSAP